MTHPEQTNVLTYRFPMWKVFCFLAVLAIGYIIICTFDAVAHPTISATLAVDQLQDTDSSAIAMRTYDRTQSFLPFGVTLGNFFIGLFLVFGTALFRADIVWLTTQFRRD